MNALTKERQIPCQREAPKGENLLDYLPEASQGVEEISTRAPNVIKTPGVFSMMELPTELRLKVPYPSPIFH